MNRRARSVLKSCGFRFQILNSQLSSSCPNDPREKNAPTTTATASTPSTQTAFYLNQPRNVHPLSGGPDLPVAEFFGEGAPFFFGVAEFYLDGIDLVVEVECFFCVRTFQHFGVE